MEAQELSRREAMERDGAEVEMPPVDAGGYIMDYLWEIGPVTAIGMGTAAITHEAIRAWQKNIGVRLHPWEARFLRSLSGEYLAESGMATDVNRPAPWLSGVERGRATARDLRESIRGLSKL